MSQLRLGIVIALAAVGAGCGGDSTTSSTPPASTKSTSAPATTKSTSTPAPAATGDAAVGKTLFEGKCQGCHAKDGTERNIGPRLAGGGRIEARIRNQVVNGSRSSGIMPPGLYSGTDLDNVVAFVLSIQ